MAAKFFQNVFSAQFTLNNGHSTTAQTIATLSGYTCIDAIYVSSTDSAAKDLQLIATIGGNDQILGTFSIPANSGNTNALPVVSLLKSAMWDLNNDISNNKVLELPSGAVLKAKILTSAITSTRFINLLFTGSQDVA